MQIHTLSLSDAIMLGKLKSIREQLLDYEKLFVDNVPLKLSIAIEYIDSIIKQNAANKT